MRNAGTYLPKPTIAQVHGYCLAGATEFVGHCDLVFAADDAQFGHPAGRSLGVSFERTIPLLIVKVGRYPVITAPSA